ncbi:hypothetical protein ASF72_01650 [Arthrobacter sp. Leaf141]|uniref:hypothetical protein n=1 Tax=Arthrobacter sp. Leaf141 TaxID=1736273 RepID=UPI0006FF2CBB|nr:hypothetical protein [Arthrobacter sp. Leaf141]KQQ96391.1 hypothetical protein ASF72_01650 [Arthrobacter sp. Leaf141]
MRAPNPSRWFYRFSILTLFSAAVALSILVNIIGDPKNSGGHSGWFIGWGIFGILSAIVSVAVFLATKHDNPTITLTRNGISLLGVAGSALAFNFPASWLTGIGWVPLWSTAIGWVLISITLLSLEPIWKIDAKTANGIADLELEILKLQEEVQNRKTTLGQGSLRTKSRKAKGGKK